uniref:Uncharacterized protein n=1 Tax=Acrobeloides nanus TaxID=290746 RepID=A0A914C4D6_9BILA
MSNGEHIAIIGGSIVILIIIIIITAIATRYAYKHGHKKECNIALIVCTFGLCIFAGLLLCILCGGKGDCGGNGDCGDCVCTGCFVGSSSSSSKNKCEICQQSKCICNNRY